MATELVIVNGGLDDPRVVALLQEHFRIAHEVTPPGSAHALDLDGLRGPALTFWTGYRRGEPATVGA